MRTTVNLSNRPFTNHRLLWISLAAIVLISLWLTLSVSGQKSYVIARADQKEQMVKDGEEELARLKKEIELREKENLPINISQQDAYQLAAARRLISLKSFSWNRLLTDIEAYVPEQARITSIKVGEMLADGNVLAARVEIKAMGKNAAQLTEMMSKLDKSGGLFLLGETGQEQTTDEGEVPFTINVIYRPGRGGA
ncbi:MAG TPA: hypothetical protein VID27_03320 [Blastocatellia bacterium]|jgi:Tfp pilus assembly protein PilN